MRNSLTVLGWVSEWVYVHVYWLVVCNACLHFFVSFHFLRLCTYFCFYALSSSLLSLSCSISVYPPKVNKYITFYARPNHSAKLKNFHAQTLVKDKVFASYKHINRICVCRFWNCWVLQKCTLFSFSSFIVACFLLKDTVTANTEYNGSNMISFI